MSGSLEQVVPTSRAGGAVARLRPYALAATGGIVTILSFPGANLWPLAFVSFVPLLMSFEGATPRQAFLRGWLAGFLANAVGFYWIVHTVQAFGQLPLGIAIVAYLLMVAANGFGWGVFGAVTRVYPGVRAGSGIEPPWWFPAFVFAAMEFAWWSVFPAYFGAGMWKAPVMMQVADLGSVLACSFLLVLWNGALWQGTRALRGHGVAWKPALGVGVVVLAAWTGYGVVRIAQVEAVLANARSLRIGMPQSNIGAGTKRMGGQHVAAVYQQMTRELERLGVDLIVWPETAYPYQLPAGTENARFATGVVETPVVLGAVTLHERTPGTKHDREHNSAVLVARDGSIRGQSHKIFMVPFGEYLPFGERFPQLYEIIPAISHLTPGREPLPLVLEEEGLRLGSLICYEDILPGFTRDVVRATDPNLIVNLTNDSWYGDSTEPTIHLALATFRAVEHRRGLVRSTNTGISALIDPLGRVVTRSGQHTRELVVGELPLLENGRTLYGWAGDWLGWICLAGVGGVAFRRWRGARRG